MGNNSKNWFNGPFPPNREKCMPIHIYPIPPMNGFRFTTEKVFFLDRVNINTGEINNDNRNIKENKKNINNKRKPWLR